MGSNCCKGDAAGRPIKSSSSIYSRSRAGASLDDRFRTSEDAGGVRLTVSAARTGDSGIYTLQASNAAGKDTRRLRLEVSAEETPSGDNPPTFLRRLQDLTVKVGTRTRFLVEIISSTECKVTWYRNERRLMEAERVSLVRDGNFWCADVATVSVDDAGRWTCTAENIGGRASCSAHLNVLVPKAYKRPEFVEELRAVLTEQGTVSLECKVVGVPTPILRWFKDSREIKAGDVFALTANAEDPTSLGTYTCEAVNCMGRAYSSSKVHVIGRGSRDGSLRPGQSGVVSPEPPLIFTKELETQSVKICDPLTLSCHIVIPPWPRSVVWYNKEGKIEPNERYHVTEDGVGGYLLEVTSAEWRDEGEWKCVATSAGGRLGITTCYVTMDVPKNFRKPRFMENLQAILTEEGLVSFECKVVGFPTPVLSWFKDGQELKPGDVYQLTGTNSLGSYCCIARNCMGQASSSAELTVEDIQNQLNEDEKLQLFSKNQAPKFLQGLKSVEARIDEPFRFTVKVAIPPEPSVLWYRDDQPVDDSPRCHLDKEEKGGFFLDISHLEFLDQAEWKCVAINDFGHSVTSCFLKLIIPRHYKKPRFLENLQAILSDEGAVNLECKVIGVPQPVLKWYKDGEELKPGDIHRIISGQDGTCCLGTYTCEAQNCMGIAASSASLLGFDDSNKIKSKHKTEEQTLQRNLSLSTIHEERTSQMYDTPVGDITLDDKGEISFSFDGKEVSVSLYETPDLTEEEALQIVEMYADQLSENITEHNVVELPPLRFVKETSHSGNLLMEAIIIDVSPDYFASPEEDLRTEADIEDISIADENVPSQLSLDQDIEDKILPASTDEKYEIPQQLSRKKSDSQKSADEYFSLSREHSLCEEKKDDDTEVISESDLLSFASAHSSGKPKSKIDKASSKDVKEPLEDNSGHKIKSERKSRSGSRRSSAESEKSLTNRREDITEKQINVMEQTIHKNQLNEDVISISTSLNTLLRDIQKLENEIILKSEYMSSVVTASKSIEIINSVISPLFEINKTIEELKVSLLEPNEVNTTLFNNVSQSLKSLQQALTIVEKCIDVESENRTLVKKTCVLLIEKCSNQFQELMMLMKLIKTNGDGIVDRKVLFDIDTISNEIMTIINFTAGTIKTNNLLIEADKLQAEELSGELKDIRDTQKGIEELKRPLISILNIVRNAEAETLKEIPYINNSSFIIADMSASIQDLQFALEQIELMSLKENSLHLNKYNTEIINSLLNPVLELRNSFEHLSAESKQIQDKTMLSQKLTSVKSNINAILSHLTNFEMNLGSFDILQNDNKLETLQKMAHILILFESNLTTFDHVPTVKESLNLLHKKLTKILENVIEGNEAKKYYDFVEICDVIKRVNNCNQNVDSHTKLASIGNSLNIVRDCLVRNVFDPDLNKSVITNISELQICIQEIINQEEQETLSYEFEYVQQSSEHVNNESKGKTVMEHIDRTLAAIAVVTSFQSVEEQNSVMLQSLENVIPILEELKNVVPCSNLSGIEREEHVSEITEVTSESVDILAKPLFEMNRHVSVLSEMLLEHPESIKKNHQPVSIVVQALNELCETLEILQHDIISQLGEYPHRSFSFNFADTVQSLHSAILVIHNNIELEVPDDLSTLEDISVLKTTADTVQSDNFPMPIIHHREMQEFLVPTTELTLKSSLAHILQALNKLIILLQNQQIQDILEKISKNKLPARLSLPSDLINLQLGIQEIFHPMMLQSSENVIAVTTTNEIGSLSESIFALRQRLSQITTENIPILEGIVDISSDLTHSVILSIAELKDHLDKCINVIFPSMEVANRIVNVSNNISTLKETCEILCDIIADASASNSSFNEKLKPLKSSTKKLLNALDVSKKIDISKIKHLTEELYKESTYVEEDILSLAPLPLKQMEDEAHLVEALHEIESSISILEQYEYVSLSDTFNLHYCKPQQVKEIEPQLLCQLDDILIATSNVMHIYKNNCEIQEDIKSFLTMCKNKFIILRSLIKKKLTHKHIIRLYQEFIFLHNFVNLFKTNALSVPPDVQQVLAEYIENTNNFLNRVRTGVINILKNNMELIFTIPMRSLTENCYSLVNNDTTVGSSDLTNTIQAFINAKEIILPSLNNLDVEIINDLNSTESNYEINVMDENVIKAWKNLEVVFAEYVAINLLNAKQKQQIDKASQCLLKSYDFKHSNEKVKQLILLKNMAEFSEILKEIVLESNDLLNIKLQKQKCLEISLSQIDIELFALCEKLKGYKKIWPEQNTDPSLDSHILSLNENFIEFMVEYEPKKHFITIGEVKSLIIRVCNKIHSLKKHLKSFDGQISPTANPINNFANTIDDFEKLIIALMNSQETENVQIPQTGKITNTIGEFVSKDNKEIVIANNNDVKQAVVDTENAINSETITEGIERKHEKEEVNFGKMMDHIDEFVSNDTVEVINKIAITSNVINADKTVKLATELKESICAINLSPETHLSEEIVKENLRESDVSLAVELQQALSVVITEIYEKAEELSSQFDGINMQQVQSNLTSLSSDINELITSTQVVEKTDDVKRAVVDMENAINSETITEGVERKHEKEEVNFGKMMDHIDEFVSNDTVKVINKIAITSNVINADKTVKLATELKESICAINLSPETHLSEEIVKENLRESDVSLAVELQQALSVVITEIYEKAEELSSQFDGINMQQVQSNLTSLSSDLNELITSTQVVEKTDDVKRAVVDMENAINSETITEGVERKHEKEEVNFGKMMDHIDEFVSNDTVEVINKIAITSNVINADKTVKLATELKESICAINLSPETHLSEEIVKENLRESDVSLAVELQQALSVVITEIYEKAEELSSQFDGINMLQVQSNLTSLSSDLNELITSTQVVEKTDDVKRAVVDMENAINSETITEGVERKHEKEEVNFGKMMDHIDEFVSNDTVEVINKIAITSNVINADKTVKLATELKESICAINLSPETHLSEEIVKENLRESDVSLAVELQQALSVVITEIYEKAEELSSQFDGINMQQVQSNLTSLSSDLNELITSTQVVEKTDDVKRAVVDMENAINSETITEGVERKHEKEEVNFGKMMDHIDEFVSNDTVEVINKIAITSNVINADKTVKLATELKESICAINLSPETHLSEEIVKENLRESDVSLAVELQQALSVVITEIYEKAEQLSSQFDGINMQQVQSNLTSLSSDLNELITSTQVVEKTDDVKRAVVDMENAINSETITEGVERKHEKEEVNFGKMMDHIDEFVSNDTVEVINKIAITSNVINADKTVKLATELKESICAINLSPETHLSEEIVKENLRESDVSLAVELQQALSVVITEIYEKAEELSSQFDGINMQQVQSNLTSLSSDLNELITSTQVVEKTDDVKRAVVDMENAINSETITEGVERKHEKEEVNFGKMMDHIDEFVSNDTVEVINKIAITSNIINADKTVKLATELKESICAINLSPETHLSEEIVKENLRESDVTLAVELQQALSVVITEIYEKAEELSLQFGGINMQQVQSNLTSLSSDLNELITSTQVVEKTDDVKQAVVDTENAINSETITEGIERKHEKEEVNFGKMMDHIDEFVSNDTVEVINKIAITSNVINADKTVKLATELKESICAINLSPETHLSEEIVKENLRESDVSLAVELQQALSVVITEIYEKAEELSSQFDGINMQQVQSNLTSLSSDLNELITSTQVVEKTDDVKRAVVDMENAINSETITEGVERKHEKEEVNFGKMMDHIDEFVSNDTVEVINKIAITSNVINADKTVKLATELKESICAINLSPETHLSEEIVKENLRESDVSLAVELQQALSVVITEIYEKAEEISSQFDGINMPQVQSNLTSLSSDLNELITSTQVVEKTDDVKRAVVDTENAINSETITEGVERTHEKEEVNFGKMMDHIDEFVSDDTVEVINKIAITSNVINADKTVKLATELKESICAINLSPETHLSEEIVKENLRESDVSLAVELQQALSVVITEIYEKAEELSSQFDGIIMQQVQSNLTSLSSDLNELITSTQVVEKTDDVKRAVVDMENAINSETITEGVERKHEKEEVNFGKMMDHIDEFVSNDTVEVINKIAITSNVINADKTVKLATELKESICAINLSPETHLSEEIVKENLRESDLSLAVELQQALSVVITEIYEKAEELSSQFDGINMQQVQSNLTSLSSDLNELITSTQVVEKTDDVKRAVVDMENAINSETITEGVERKHEKEEVNFGKMMDHIDEFVSNDTVEVINKIAITSNVINADKTVKLATELKESICAINLSPETHLSEEIVKENLRESDVTLAVELQQALSVVITEIYEKAEELSSQFDGINMQQVQSNLTSLSSDLNELITSTQVVEKTDDVKRAVVDMENAINSETITEGVERKHEKEEVNFGKMMDHIDEFVSDDTVEVINKIAITSNVINADKTVKLARELKESICAINLSPETHLSEEIVKENLRESDLSLAVELQQALSVVITEIYEKAEELSSQFDGINMQQVQSNLTSLSSDLNELITSTQVVEKTDDVKRAVVDMENAINSETITEGVERKHEKEEVNFGKMMDHIDEFVSNDTVEVINKIAITSNIINADKTVKLATELKESICAINLSPETHLSEEIVKENLRESDVTLAVELQQALSVVITEIYEKAEELSLQFDGINMQQVQSNLTSLSSDLNELITSTQVVEKTDDVKRAVVDMENAINSETITEGIERKHEKEEVNFGKMMDHIDEFVSNDTVEVINKIAITSNIINADKTVKLATELKESICAINLSPETHLSEEIVKENLRESDVTLAVELQQALSVVITEIYEKAEELSLQFDGINMQQVQSNLTSLSSDLNELITSTQVVEKTDDVKRAVVDMENAINSETITEGVERKHEKEEVNFGKMMDHIDEFVSNDTVEVINKIAITSNVINADKTVKLATELKESICAINLSPETHLSEEIVKENLRESDVSLAVELQQALSVVITEIYEKAEELSSQFDGINMQQVQSNLTSLSSDLNELITSTQVVEKTDDVKRAVVDNGNAINLKIVTEDETQKEHRVKVTVGSGQANKEDKIDDDNGETKNTLYNLKSLLKEVCDKISILTTCRAADDLETLQNTLDEIQAVIIKLKRDYNESVYDTLNESLQDLECSLRSVQLQINEESPPELVNEACESLQLLVSNLCEMHEFQVVQTTGHKEKLGNIISSCSNDTEETIYLLESVLSMKSDDKYEFDRLYTYVNDLQIIIKTLKVSFADNSEKLIEKGIEIMQNLDQIEDQVFDLEKEVDMYKNISPVQRDSIVTAIHSVYGSISNMRSAMSSAQKHYMYENYGKSSELILSAMKCITFIANKTDKNWKTVSKSLRKVLNHFEDIKFYINFDKTARIPCDAAFTKIILLDLKAAIESLIFDNDTDFGEDIMSNTKCVVECLEINLLNMESKSNLQVKEKIPIFKSIGQKIYTLTSSIKEYLELAEKREKHDNIEALQPQDLFNIETNELHKESIMAKGPIDNEQIEDIVKDVLTVTIEQLPFKEKDVVHTEEDAIQHSSGCIKNDNLNSGYLNTTQDIDIKEKYEDTAFTINTHALDFALEILPETIMPENIIETSALILEEHEHLKTPLVQIIDADILYKARVNEAEIEYIIDSDSKEHLIGQDSKEVGGIENEKLILNQTPEVEPMFKETNDYSLIGPINETNERSKKELDESNCVTNKETIEEISIVSGQQSQIYPAISTHIDNKSEQKEYDFVAEKIAEDISQIFVSAVDNNIDMKNVVENNKILVDSEEDKHLTHSEENENKIIRANTCDYIIDSEMVDERNILNKSDQTSDHGSEELNVKFADKAILELDSLHSEQIDNIGNCKEKETNVGNNYEISTDEAIKKVEILEKPKDNETLLVNVQNLSDDDKNEINILKDNNETVEIKVDTNSQIKLLKDTEIDKHVDLISEAENIYNDNNVKMSMRPKVKDRKDTETIIEKIVGNFEDEKESTTSNDKHDRKTNQDTLDDKEKCNLDKLTENVEKKPEAAELELKVQNEKLIDFKELSNTPNSEYKHPIKQEIEDELPSPDLVGEVVQKKSSKICDEDSVSQNIILRQTITNDEQLKASCSNQNRDKGSEEETVLGTKADLEKSTDITCQKIEDKSDTERREESNTLAVNKKIIIDEIKHENIDTDKEKKCTDEIGATNKHQSEEKPIGKKKEVRTKEQVESPTTENMAEESENNKVKENNVLQQKDTLQIEEKLLGKSIGNVKEKQNKNHCSEITCSSDNIILDNVLQEREREEKLLKAKVENENTEVETDLSTKNISTCRREDDQNPKTVISNNPYIEKIPNTKCIDQNVNIENNNESRLQISKEFNLQLEKNSGRHFDVQNEITPKDQEDDSLEQIHLSQIKNIEITSYDNMYGDATVSVENYGKGANTTAKKNAVFIDRTKNYYENEFLRPPGYVERTFNNDQSTSEYDIAQSYPFYKAQTLVCTTQYISPLLTGKIENDESAERKDVSHKLKALNETRSFMTEKHSKLLRNVKRKPVFSTYLTDRTAVEGSRVKLTCSVLTTLEPKIMWFKNGVLLNNKLKYRTKSIDGLLTMEVLNAEPSDSAEYSCTVETENGSVTTSAILKVYPSFEVSPIPPTFTRSIRDKYHLAENELVLECRIRGQPLPSITWLKDDRVINITDRYQAYYLADGVCRLAIGNPSAEDSGKYTCKAENSMWSDQISHVVTFTEPRFGLHCTSGESSRLNRQISEARRPHFTNVLTDYKVSSGGTIGLQVEIKGSPTRVEWLREGHSITDIYRNAQTFVDHGLYTLALSDVTEKESGIYTCRAWSNHGNVDMTASITVVQPNEIDGKPAVIIGRPQKDVLISVGEDLNISFRVQGEPKPKVTLMKGIRDITNSPRVCKMKSDDYIKFTLKRSVVSDAGTYCIFARNAYGCDRAFVTVVVRQRASSDHLISDWTYPTDSTITVEERKYKTVPNRIPGEPSVVDGGNNWISLAWPKVNPEGGAPVLAYKIESWLLGKEGGARWVELGITPLNTFEAYNLKQGEEYHFRVTPRNRYGWGESVQTSTSVGVGLAGDRPEFVDVLPGQLKVLVGETATLKCSFKGKPTPEIVWMKNGHEIDEEHQRLKICLSNYNSSLTINDVQINDEARYSCEASNLHGRASTYARIAVVTDKNISEADTKLKRERSSDGGECPPQFTMRLRDRRVQATYPVRLTCQVIGRPPPFVTWYKNGEEVVDDNRRTKSQDEHFHTLEIAPTTLEDGGLYEATARNGNGAISCRCNLVVDKGIRAYIAPEFCCGLEPLYQLSIGQELRISAVVEAYPSVGVTWYRDGVRLRPSRRAVMTLDRDGQIELAVGSVTQRDAGVYTCTASNEVGKASTSGKVEVFGESDGERKQAIPTVICSDVPYSREPSFIKKPRSSEAYEGDNIIIECEVTGDPKPDVFWLRDFLKPDYYRDGSHFKRVGAGPEYRFEIPHAKLDYTGAYSVVARNVYGEAKAVISLQILAKDPRSTEEAHNVRYGRVEVIPRFEKELTDLLSHDGDAIEFECRVTGEPEPDIKWYHYTKIIRECSDFETSYDLGTARLKIKQVTADDEGTYTCEAYNYLGKATSKACLVVYPAGEPNTLSQRLRRPPVLLSAASTPRSTPARSISRTRTPGPDIRSLCSPAREIAPKFYTYPYNKVAEEGDTVVFQCAAKGVPAPWATWDKDGVVITPSARITIKEKDEIFRILEIDEVNSEDVGLYRVTLENDYGRAEATARLEVISQKGKFYASGRSYSASPRKTLPYKRSMYSLPRQD